MRNIKATGQLFGDTITVNQISKAKARKLFNAGTEIFLQSSNMHPFGVWQSLCPIKYDEQEADNTVDQFDFLVNSFQWYNCDNERGKYAHFYSKI